MVDSLFTDNPAAEGLRTAYYDTGTSGYPLVLVHGFTGSRLDFLDQLDWFEDIARVVALDQRGHGESSNAPPYSLDGLVDELMGFLNAIDVHRCTLLGHSMGGMVAMRAVLQHPDWFTSLILMDSTPSPIQLFPSDAIRRSVLATIEQGGCEALLGNMRGQPRSAAQQLGVDFLGEHEHWRRIRTKLTQMDPRAFADLSEEMSLQDVSTALPEIDCPTTIIVGEHDQPFREPARIMTNLIPKANLQVIEGAAHSPQYENAEAWKAAVRGHLLANGP